MNVEKLIYMANQIGASFQSQKVEDAVELTAQHIQLYWDPRMRAAIIEHQKAGCQGLNAISSSAVLRLSASGV